MEVPDLVRTALGDEPVARVPLGGEDGVYITPTRTLVYRGEGLLSDESLSEYSHDVERIDLDEGRRKATFQFEYLDGTREFTVPNGRVDAILRSMLAGVLYEAGVLTTDETVAGVYRFSELTLVITSRRVVKNVGEEVWGPDYEEYEFGDVTGLDFEEGTVATQIVIEVEGRPQRIKTPNDAAGTVRKALQEALFAYHDVSDLDELEEEVGIETDDEPPRPGGIELSEGIDPLMTDADEIEEETESSDADGDEDADTDATEPATASGSGSGFEFGPQAVNEAGEEVEPDAGPGGGTGGGSEAVSGGGVAGQATAEELAGNADGDLAAQLAALAQAVERQNQLLERHQATIEQLIDELSRGR